MFHGFDGYEKDAALKQRCLKMLPRPRPELDNHQLVHQLKRRIERVHCYGWRMVEVSIAEGKTKRHMANLVTPWAACRIVIVAKGQRFCECFCSVIRGWPGQNTCACIVGRNSGLLQALQIWTRKICALFSSVRELCSGSCFLVPC